MAFCYHHVEIARDFNDVKSKVIEVAFSTSKQYNALQGDFKHISPVMVGLRKLYEKGRPIEELDLRKLMRLLPNRSDLMFSADVVMLLQELTKGSEENQFIGQVFNYIIENLPEGSNCVLEDLFPALVIKGERKIFWKDVYDLMEAWHLSEAEVLNSLDRTGEKRAKYPRPAGFPGCFASPQPQPIAVPLGGSGSVPVGAMSPDAQ